MRGLHTDLYQLTMGAGYFSAGRAFDTAVFELFVRRLPRARDLLVAAGLQQAVEYLLNLSFTGEQIAFLRTLPQFARASEDFWDYLRTFRFTGDLFAMREGTPFFAGEPVLTIRAPLIEAQLVETYLSSSLAFQSMIASKAVRVVAAAQGRSVVEFGARRAHGPEAGVLAGRAAYIAGCLGTSNVEAGYLFGVPVFGTSAHSWVLAFENETEAFRELQRFLGTGTVYLIDSFDTIKGAQKAAALGPPMWGVRLDSGDLTSLAKQVRQILDRAGFPDARIMATSDLDEDRIRTLLTEGAPIDVFGVGTQLATSYDAPALGAIYKLVELEVNGEKRYAAKYSPDKQTLPGAKQVFRTETRDLIACATECGGGEALLQPVIIDGQLVQKLPAVREARDYCATALRRVSSSHRVEYSAELLHLAEKHNREFA